MTSIKPKQTAPRAAPPKTEAPSRAPAAKAVANAAPHSADEISSSVKDPRHAPRAVIGDYYRAMNGRDIGKLRELYAPSATFRDNVFKYDDAKGILKMWKSLPKDAKVKHEIVSASGDTVTTKISWSYTMLGRKVVNDETATFRVKDGKIVEQREVMDFPKWAKQVFPFVPKFVFTKGERFIAPLLGKIAG